MTDTHTTEALKAGPGIEPGNPIATLPKGQKVGMDLQLYAGRLMPDTFGQVVEFAQMMCKAGLAIPKHLRENPGTCMSVIQRSIAWEMDPWAVATKTYVVNDILAYEAQLIAAVIMKWAPIKERVIPYRFEGAGGDLRCTITVHHSETGEEIAYKSPLKKEIKVQNSPLWTSDPEQQLGYYSIRALARRHFPAILLGVYDREEVLAMRDITPKGDKPQVENMLNDDPVEGEVLPPADGYIKPITKDGKPIQAGDIPQGSEVTYDQETGEIQEIVPPEKQAENMLKYIRGETDHVLLEEWQNLNHEAINALPQALGLEVRNALDLRHQELAEL